MTLKYSKYAFEKTKFGCQAQLIKRFQQLAALLDETKMITQKAFLLYLEKAIILL